MRPDDVSPDERFSGATVLRCPHCEAESRERIPTDACVVLHDCSTCGREIRPEKGDCCVFCSHGAHPCPSAVDRGR